MHSGIIHCTFSQTEFELRSTTPDCPSRYINATPFCRSLFSVNVASYTLNNSKTCMQLLMWLHSDSSRQGPTLWVIRWLTCMLMEQAWGSRCSSDFCFFAMAEPYGSQSAMPVETPLDKPDLHGYEYKLKIVCKGWVTVWCNVVCVINPTTRK